MPNLIISVLILISGLLGGFFLNKTQVDYDAGGKGNLIFGSTSYPSALDALSNPNPTDSVSTVSHSGQHSNANDAIEALEAKLGITASTPVSGTVFVGDGVGTSRYSTYATTTSLRSTNITATGSTTLQDFTFVNATGTSATTTNFSALNASTTNATTTNLNGTNINGFNLTTCQTNNVLTWASGLFGCETDDTGGATIVSTTTTANMSSTTVAVAAFNTIKFSVLVPDVSGAGATTSASIDLHFNSTKTTTYSYSLIKDGVADGTVVDATFIRLVQGDGNLRPGRYVTGHFLNITSQAKVGSYQGINYATTTGPYSANTANLVAVINEGRFLFSSGNARITTFEVGTNLPNTFMATGTVITVEASN